MSPTHPPRIEYQVTWKRQGWLPGVRSSKKFGTEAGALRFARALENDQRTDRPRILDVVIYARDCGEWRVVPRRKDGAR